jgi:GT2 family glycosyltransferase
MNLAVCIPVSWDKVHTDFLIAFSRLFRPEQLNEMERLGVKKFWQLFNRVFPLDLNRNRLVQKSLELGADAVLFLDADMTFPADLIPRLIQDLRETGPAIISGLYFKKTPPFPPVSANKIFSHDEQKMFPVEIDSGHPDSADLSDYMNLLLECDVVGMGAALIARELLEAISPPWFEYELYQKTGERTVTEDVPFCRKVKQAGFKIYTDLGLECGHITTIAITRRHWNDQRQKIIARTAGAINSCFCGGSNESQGKENGE